MDESNRVCPESTIESANVKNYVLKADTKQSDSNKNLRCESTIESANRRNFVKRATIVTALAGVGSTILSKNIVPGSSASSYSRVTGTCSKENGIAVCGSASGCSGIGVEGTATGVCGRGVAGYANLSSGTGVQGNSTCGTGVGGISTCGTGVNGHSCSGVGVSGSSISYTGIGVSGSSSFGPGVQGTSCCGPGVKGVSGGPCSIPVVAQGIPAQTAPLQEWQNSSGAPLSVVNNKGYSPSGKHCEGHDSVCEECIHRHCNNRGFQQNS